MPAYTGACALGAPAIESCAVRQDAKLLLTLSKSSFTFSPNALGGGAVGQALLGELLLGLAHRPRSARLLRLLHSLLLLHPTQSTPTHSQPPPPQVPACEKRQRIQRTHTPPAPPSPHVTRPRPRPNPHPHPHHKGRMQRAPHIGAPGHLATSARPPSPIRAGA